MTKQRCLWLAVLAQVVANWFLSLAQVAVCTMCQLGCKQPLSKGGACKCDTALTLLLYFIKTEET